MGHPVDEYDDNRIPGDVETVLAGQEEAFRQICRETIEPLIWTSLCRLALREVDPTNALVSLTIALTTTDRENRDVVEAEVLSFWLGDLSTGD